MRGQGQHQQCPEEPHPGSVLSSNNSHKSPAWTGQSRPTNHRPFHLGSIFDRELRVSTHPSTLVKVWGNLTVTILPFVLEDPAEIEIIREYKSYEVNSCVAANQKEWEFHN